ncbi:hypothetical protein [Bartonella krasnovii]|uniref:Phage related protein n=2 Tax=Bartonella TaxID=773 RepID=A0ABY3VTU9_9HYPH|nr:hypothetical protein [Bartonella krasnovii]UNF28759.1 hypothetical protein MNL13_05940 [Bartonella krasnovii]UNF35134.1 hypothetical protein MNL12_05945 [Bartonella krasnovii]UNF39511.1 hypothetical protein MNL10_03550 [Bartonella krasnovii]UNF45194.1 hypothetical protein MNL06_06510 [Bartonella krasnovii]UNF47712.1 hypothetical protein MNL05_03340 [Bartonella krasnovii]
MQKKFALTNETRVFDNQILYRIKALKDFADIKAGDLGGFIENESNLSHDGNCWVGDNAYVVKTGRVYDNARVYGNAGVGGYVYGNAKVYDFAKVFAHAHVYDNAQVFDSAKIISHVHIYENACAYGMAIVTKNAFGDTRENVYTERLSPYGEISFVMCRPIIKQQ